MNPIASYYAKEGHRSRFLTRFRDWYFEGGSATVETMPVLSTRLYRHAQPLARDAEPAAWLASAVSRASVVSRASAAWRASAGDITRPTHRAALLGHATGTRPALIGCRP